MPVYAQSDLDEFMKRVRQQNPHFERFKDSSLHTLIQQLKKNSTSDQILREISKIPLKKQQDYKPALNYLRQTFPGLTPPSAPKGTAGLPVMPGQKMLSTAGAKPLNVIPKTATQPPRPAPAAGPGVTVVNTPIPTLGYSLIVDPQPVTLVPAPQRVGALTMAEVSRINEAIARTRKAVDLAIEKLRLAVPPVGAFPPGAEYDRYVRFFGAYDVTRKGTVIRNFVTIASVLGGARGGTQGQLHLVDSRNDLQKLDWFAATVRNSIQNNTVLMYLGRLFFLKGDYARTSDATVVTLVHELAHACFGASDVPTVGSGAVLQANGMPPPGVSVCNDLASDVELAANFPDRAILNADNYGQYAWSIMQEELI